MINKKKIYLELKKKKIKVINEYKIKNKLFIIINDNKKIKILKYFINQAELPYLKNEIKGYRYFKKNNKFYIPKLYNYCLKKDNLFICLEYIKGECGSFFELNNFHNNQKIIKKNNFKPNTYLNKILAFYKNGIDSRSKQLIKKLKNKIIKSKINLKLSTAYSHGDFAKYNSIKNKSKYYVIDLEKFRERIINYDQLNWISHSILYNLSKIYTLIKFNFLKKIFLSINKEIILVFYIIFKYFFNNKIFNFKKFRCYYIFFILEKYLICKNDFYKISNKKEKKIITNLIFLSETLLVELVNTEFK